MNLIAATSNALPWRRTGKPLLIWLAPPFLALYGLALSMFLFAVLADDGGGSLTIGSTPVGPVGTFAFVLPVMTTWCAVYLLGAVGLFRERVWARPLLVAGPLALHMIVSISVVMLAATPLRGFMSLDWSGLAVSAAAYLYLYHYGPAVEYYDRLQANHGDPGERVLT